MRLFCFTVYETWFSLFDLNALLEMCCVYLWVFLVCFDLLYNFVDLMFCCLIGCLLYSDFVYRASAFTLFFINLMLECFDYGLFMCLVFDCCFGWLLLLCLIWLICIACVAFDVVECVGGFLVFPLVFFDYCYIVDLLYICFYCDSDVNSNVVFFAFVIVLLLVYMNMIWYVIVWVWRFVVLFWGLFTYLLTFVCFKLSGVLLRVGWLLTCFGGGL